jgi:uncharacterized membrane protein YtjA (UPF0391 family)
MLSGLRPDGALNGIWIDATMKKYLFLGLAIVSGIIAFAGIGPKTEGIAKGLFGTFFILFMVFTLIGKQPTDNTTH